MLLTEVAVVLFSFFAMLVDCSLGMGYGSILTPLLLLLGFSPMLVVPSMLLAVIFNGVAGGAAHHFKGNVNFDRESIPLKKVLFVVSSGLLGVVASVIFATSVPQNILKGIIGSVIMVTGAVVYRNRRARPFSWAKFGLLSLVASFNQGISGAAYGPLMTSGQILMGGKTKPSIGITVLSEGLISIFAVLAYISMGGIFPNLRFAALLVIGAVPAAPLAASIVRGSTRKSLSHSIGGLTVALGMLTILSAVVK